MNYHKSGNINGAVGSIIALIVGVGVSVMILVFVGVLSGQTYQMQETNLNTISKYTVTSESHTSLNGIATTLDHNPLWTGTLSIKNGSQVVPASNWTADYTAGTYTLKATSLWNNTALSSSYTYGNEEIQAAVKGSIISGFGALQQTGDYLPIIVLAVVITMVLALVLSMKGMNGGSSGDAL
jgi:hypothetical protein